MSKYVVKATAWGKSNKTITKAMSKNDARTIAKNLKSHMSRAIPKYRWARNVRIVKSK